MSVLLICPKRRGNTFRVCTYVAERSDAELLVIEKGELGDLKKYTSIVLCSGVYGGNVHKALLRWLGRVEKTAIHEDAAFHVFLTWLGRGQSDKDAVRHVRDALEKNGLDLQDDYMTCYGKAMGIIRYSHPSREDCERVLDWVRKKA